jgi:hypothetical protein
VLDALALADQLRAGDRLVVAAYAAEGELPAVELLTQRLEPGQRLGLQPAIGEFLDTIRQAALQKAPVLRRRLPAAELPPLLLQRAGAYGLQCRQPPQNVRVRGGRRPR